MVEQPKKVKDYRKGDNSSDIIVYDSQDTRNIGKGSQNSKGFGTNEATT